jgi:hypothetical protein
MPTSHYRKNLNDTSRSLKVKKKKILDGTELNFFFCENAKGLAFRCIDRKESYMYKSKKNQHRAIQLNLEDLI